MSPRGTPKRVVDEAARRSERVRVVVWLERGQIEDLQVILSVRRGRVTRSAVVREAVGWLLAREANSLVRHRQVAARRRQREAEEARAVRLSRAEREDVEAERVRELALEIARHR